jgi:hypothetical protein
MLCGQLMRAPIGILALVLLAACPSGSGSADGPHDEFVNDRPPALDRPEAAADGSDGPVTTLDGPAGDRPADVPADAQDAGPDLPADRGSDGGVRCGSRTCAPSELCIQECFCGGAAVCMPAPDGGQCVGSPACQRPGGGAGCQQPCDNPPPRCVTSLASCAGAPSMPPADRVILCACPP